MVRVFDSGSGDLGSIPGGVIPKTLKWHLIHPCLTLSNIRYVSKVNWSNPGKGVVASPTPRCSTNWKWAFCSPSTTVAKFIYIYIYIYIYIWCAFNKVPDFFVQAFRMVVDSRKLSMLLLYILWDDLPIFMISGSNEQLQQQLKYTLLKPDCHSWSVSKMQSGRHDTLKERYAIKFCFTLGKKYHRNVWNGSDCFSTILHESSISFWVA